MINIKHFLDAVEPEDGLRLWVEPIGLTRDFRAWCAVSHLLVKVTPPRSTWDWFERHDSADAYEYFRGVYHEHLSNGPYIEGLRTLAQYAVSNNVTLLHQGDDPRHNSAVALYEFLSELQSYCQPDA